MVSMYFGRGYSKDILTISSTFRVEFALNASGSPLAYKIPSAEKINVSGCAKRVTYNVRYVSLTKVLLYARWGRTAVFVRPLRG